MRDLTVYDSQGAPIDAEAHGQVNERIKDFFFGGVRLALETVGNGYKLTAFFRARDSSASRSEQYYGVLETDDEQEISNFSGIIEDHLQTEYGKELVTTKEDTTVFEELSGGTLLSAPGDQSTRNDIAELVNEGEQALVGVGSYEDATTLLQSFLGDLSNPRIAIAENAQSSTLSEYGLVIEKGSYTGLELLGDTDDRIEDMKERKRRQREQMLGGGPGMDPYGQQQQTGPFGLSTRALAGVLVGGVVALLLIASLGSCVFLGISVPGIGGLLECGGGGGGDGGPAGPAVSIENATLLTNSAQPTLHVEGTLSVDGSPINGSTLNTSQAPLTYVVANDSGTEIAADTVETLVTDNGTFVLEPNMTVNETSYNVTVKWRGANATATAEWQSSSSDTGGTQTDDGTTEPENDTASFAITNIDVLNGSDGVTEGELLSFTATLNNEGSAPANRTVQLLNESGGVLDSAQVHLNASDSTFQSLSWTEVGDAGKHDITVAIAETEVSQTVTVTVQEKSNSTPKQTTQSS